MSMHPPPHENRQQLCSSVTPRVNVGLRHGNGFSTPKGQGEITIYKDKRLAISWGFSIQNRANRVTQLCNDIAQLQTQVKEAVEDAKTQDERSVVILQKIAKQRGYKTLDEFVAAAEKQLSGEERTRYEDMKRELEKKDKDIDLAMKISFGLNAVGRLAGLTSFTISLLFNTTLVSVALRAFAVALVRIVTGSVQDGLALFKAGGNALKVALKGERLAGNVAKVFKFLKTTNKVLGILSAAFDLGLIIYDAIDGAQQRRELQKAIKDLCLRRLTTKKIQQSSRVTLQFSSDAKAIVDLTSTLQELVEDGTIDQAKADEKTAKKMQELEPKLAEAIDGVNDKAVYDMLKQHDEGSTIAWTNEDPSFDELEKLAKKLEESEKSLEECEKPAA